MSDVIPMANTAAVKSFFQTVIENGQEIIELLESDNEIEADHDLSASEDNGMSSDTLVQVGHFDIEMDSDDDDEELHQFHDDREKSDLGSSESDSDSDFDYNRPASSNWLDDNISSTVNQGPIKITRQCTVDAVEYLSDLPSYWPVPRNKRAYVVDLSDPKFNVYDKNGKLMTVDALIKNAVSVHFLYSSSRCGINGLPYFNQEQDSWTGSTGSGPRDNRPKIPSSVFGLKDGQEILCRRSRLTCAGYSACEYINPALVNQERFELDPESLEDVLRIQIDSRLQEADTPEKLALMYVLTTYFLPFLTCLINGP